MQQLPFSILFAWAFFVVKFYRTIYSFTFSAAFGRSLPLSLPLFVLRDMLAILVRLHNTQILCTFPRNVNNSWFLSRKLLSAEIWKISPVQCASMCVCMWLLLVRFHGNCTVCWFVSILTQICILYGLTVSVLLIFFNFPFGRGRCCNKIPFAPFYDLLFRGNCFLFFIALHCIAHTMHTLLCNKSSNQQWK